ncbi:PDZ domain-containing protein [Povalibacter sp.]|uniref:PDZ domain-containing protein n=1 Tax=Povalibacter sp. TaxID=1962978 RepID=UPI002F40C929
MQRTRSQSAGRWMGAAALVALCVSAASAATDDSAPDSSSAGQSRAETRQKLEAAQKRLDEAAREVANLSMSMSDETMGHAMAFGMGPTAVLGLTVPAGRRDTRDDGAEILSVSPGGGAAEAGLRTGDVLMEINGKPLKRSGGQGPGDKVRAAMREISPDDKVTVKYLRDGKSATATVVAKAPSDRMFNFHLAPSVGAGRMAPPWPHVAFRRVDGLFGQAELVSLTPKLGQYFGTDKGLLVVRAPSDTRLKLEEGDVILDIDGRVPSSPSHALQILTSYEGGEKLKLNVLRMKKRIAFEVTIPDDGEEDGSRSAPPRGATMPFPRMAPMPPLPPEGGPGLRRDIRGPNTGDETV